jgi:small subunit ribosomal protein S20
MANIKQQKKRIRTASRQRLENLRFRSGIKTSFRRLSESIEGGDAGVVDGRHRSLQHLIDRAASRRALHPNTAARKKAQAARLVAAGPKAEAPKKRTRRAPARSASS